MCIWRWRRIRVGLARSSFDSRDRLVIVLEEFNALVTWLKRVNYINTLLPLLVPVDCMSSTSPVLLVHSTYNETPIISHAGDSS